jgi:hypothetical protein
VKYCKVRVKRVNDFDGEPCFRVLINDEKSEVDDVLGIDFFPQGFKIGSEVTLICVCECHLKEQK